MKTLRASPGTIAIVIALAWLSGCRAGVRTVPPAGAQGSPGALSPAVPAEPVKAASPSPPFAAGSTLTRLGYTIQVGAFAVPDNARSLTRTLTAAGLDAFYFPAGSGLYKVRFGDYPSREAAVEGAKRLVAASRIKDYFIVAPEEQAVYRASLPGENLRDRLTATAASFLGVEYTWGGTTSLTGFDCSGLVRAVYQLNGINMPRSVSDQWRAGATVPRDRLSKGDLVFFSALPGGELSHVGIYVGEGAFIHAPGRGKRVRTDSLDGSYFREHFSGARAYLN